MYSQNQEEKYILDYFKSFKGNLLDIGANDGFTFSNSRALMERGWRGDLIEPSKLAFQKLADLYANNNNATLWNLAVTLENGPIEFYESGPLIGKNDISLVSTAKVTELARWKNIEFNPTTVQSITIETLFQYAHNPKWDFITIDIEGLDYDILKEIDLTYTKLVCVEHNGIEVEKYIDYCEEFGMKLIYQSGENILMAK
jgi:FkbM family methyltransferase